MLQLNTKCGIDFYSMINSCNLCDLLFHFEAESKDRSSNCGCYQKMKGLKNLRKKEETIGNYMI